MLEKEVQNFWNEQAKKHESDIIATMPDRYLKNIEIETIEKYLKSGQKVADLGCGNGYSSFVYANNFDINLLGIDFAEEMVKEAQKAQTTHLENNKSSIEFQQGDIKNLNIESNSFDIAITDRCIQNLLTREEQYEAIKEVHRILKPEGLFLMCESTQQGLANLNEVRVSVGLEKIETRWHNFFMDESHIKDSIQGLFELTEIVRFSSFYYLASRVINGKLAQLENNTPEADSLINLIGSLCSAKFDFGDYSPLKLFVLKKIGSYE